MFAVCRFFDAAADHMIAALKPERSARARKRDVPLAVGLLRSWTRARFFSSVSGSVWLS